MNEKMQSEELANNLSAAFDEHLEELLSIINHAHDAGLDIVAASMRDQLKKKAI